LSKQAADWKKFILELPLVDGALQWMRSHTMPGFRGVRLYDVAHFLYQESQRNDLNTRASAMTYHFFLALFPSLISLFTLTAYLPRELDFYTALEQALQSILPPGAKDYVIHDLIAQLRPRAQSSLLSIGFVLAIYFGSEGILAMMRGFDKTYNSSFRKRNWLETRFTAFALTIALGGLLILSVLSIILGEKLLRLMLDYLQWGGLVKLAIKSLNYLITVILFYTVISLVYRFGPALYKPIRGISPGAMFATLASIATSVLYGMFIQSYSTYHKVYGAISALIITLVWMRINTMILLLGFELNAAVAVNRDLMDANQIALRKQRAEDE